VISGKFTIAFIFQKSGLKPPTSVGKDSTVRRRRSKPLNPSTLVGGGSVSKIMDVRKNWSYTEVSQVVCRMLVKHLWGGLFVAGDCALTPEMGACLVGAMGKETKPRSSSSSNRTLKSGTWIKIGNTWIGPGGEAIFDNGSVIQSTDGSLCHRTRNALICQ
jgi:hypothetical protein